MKSKRIRPANTKRTKIDNMVDPVDDKVSYKINVVLRVSKILQAISVFCEALLCYAEVLRNHTVFAQ